MEDAVRREVQGLVLVQELRVKELEGRLAEAHEETRLWRTRTSDAESRAAAAEAKLAAAIAVGSAAHVPSHTHLAPSASGGVQVPDLGFTPGRHMQVASKSLHPLATSQSHAEYASQTAAAAAAAAAAATPSAVDSEREREKIHMASMLLQQRELVDMLEQSHAILISDSHRLRADLEAERSAVTHFTSSPATAATTLLTTLFRRSPFSPCSPCGA